MPLTPLFPVGVFSFSHFQLVDALGTYGRPGVLLDPELLSEHEGDANARGVVFGRFRERRTELGTNPINWAHGR